MKRNEWPVSASLNVLPLREPFIVKVASVIYCIVIWEEENKTPTEDFSSLQCSFAYMTSFCKLSFTANLNQLLEFCSQFTRTQCSAFLPIVLHFTRLRWFTRSLEQKSWLSSCSETVFKVTSNSCLRLDKILLKENRRGSDVSLQDKWPHKEDGRFNCS